MNKTEIIHQTHLKLDKKIPLKELDQILNTVLDVISDGLQKGEEIQLADFGTFSLAKKTIKPAIKVVKKKK